MLRQLRGTQIGPASKLAAVGNVRSHKLPFTRCTKYSTPASIQRQQSRRAPSTTGEQATSRNHSGLCSCWRQHRVHRRLHRHWLHSHRGRVHRSHHYCHLLRLLWLRYYRLPAPTREQLCLQRHPAGQCHGEPYVAGQFRKGRCMCRQRRGALHATDAFFRHCKRPCKAHWLGRYTMIHHAHLDWSRGTGHEVSQQPGVRRLRFAPVP